MDLQRKQQCGWECGQPRRLLRQLELNRDHGCHVNRSTVEEVRPVSPALDSIHRCLHQHGMPAAHAQVGDFALLVYDHFQDHRSLHLCHSGHRWIDRRILNDHESLSNALRNPEALGVCNLPPLDLNSAWDPACVGAHITAARLVRTRADVPRRRWGRRFRHGSNPRLPTILLFAPFGRSCQRAFCRSARDLGEQALRRHRSSTGRCNTTPCGRPPP